MGASKANAPGECAEWRGPRRVGRRLSARVAAVGGQICREGVRDPSVLTTFAAVCKVRLDIIGKPSSSLSQFADLSVGLPCDFREFVLLFSQTCSKRLETSKVCNGFDLVGSSVGHLFE